MTSRGSNQKFFPQRLLPWGLSRDLYLVSRPLPLGSDHHVIMILLEVGDSLVTDVSYRPLNLHPASIATERRYTNHPCGEMHQVSSPRSPHAVDHVLTVRCLAQAIFA